MKMFAMIVKIILGTAVFFVMLEIVDNALN